MIVIWRACGLLVAVGSLAAVVWASHAPITIHGEPHGTLRLAWSARPERIETCVEQSEDVLARLPQHMRQPVLCEGVTAQYQLTVRVNAKLIADRVVRGGGLRQDRRLYVFDEWPVEPGDVELEIRFDRIDGAPDSPASPPLPAGHDAVPSAAGARQQVAADTVPARLVFDERLHVGPREVLLVTYSPERKMLTAIRHGDGDRR